MPYIKERDREKLDPLIDLLLKEIDSEVGKGNYVITKIAQRIAGKYTVYHSYTSLNSAIGMLECAKMEYYRRLVAPYEDLKIKENGDVY